MKADIHPKYYPNATVICSCGNTWTTGSTQPELRTDVCSACHPFFTGEQRIVDTAGQVDRFMKRLDRYGKHQEEAAQREERLRKKAEQRFLKQQLGALDLDESLTKILGDANIVTIGEVIKKIEEDKESLLALEGVDSDAVEKVEASVAEARESFFTEE